MLLIWWYTGGLLALLRKVREHIRSFAHSWNLNVLTRYLFVPMYGYNDWASRMISFCVRVVQLIVVSIATFLYIAFEFVLIVAWVLVPVVVVTNVIYQLTGDVTSYLLW